MRKLVIGLILLGALMVWFHRWAGSGQMDAFMDRHAHPSWTPGTLFVLAEFYQLANEPKAAIHYFKWLAERYPQHSFAAQARFGLAESYEDNGQRGEAMQQYVILKDSYPYTSYGEKAKRKVELSRY